MKGVTFVKLLVVIFAVLRICVYGVFVSPSGVNGGQREGTGALHYNRDFLLRFKTLQDPLAFSNTFLPDELVSEREDERAHGREKARKRGKRGGVRRRLRRNTTKPPLPSMILSNVRSINPNSKNCNLDELRANCKFLNEFRNSCVLCFSETWLTEKMTDDSVAIDGFGTPYRMDRDCEKVGKEAGGGVCLYVNEKWCDSANVTVKKRLSTRELELISVSLRPRYLPREFGRVFLTVVYAPVFDQASAARAGQTIAATVRDLQLISADAPCFIVGDFNHCDLRKALPSFKQYVTCQTRKNKTIDLCYGNIPRAYKSVPLPSVGGSDHDTVQLIPAYRPRIKTEPVVRKSVKVWTPESVDELRGCFDCTDWSVLVDPCMNVHEAADIVSSYICFCKDMIIPTKIIKIFPNNKPWISKSVKSILNEKKIAFQSGNREDRKLVQARLRGELRKGQREYKSKVEQQFQTGKMSDAWEGLKTLTGETKKKTAICQMTTDEQTDFSNQLNDFYCRFERDDLGDGLNRVVSQLQEKVKNGNTKQDLVIDAKTVESLFLKLNVKKAIGPDNICGKLLKTCASELSDIFCKIFNWSLDECCVPTIWKKSNICPVPKKKNPATLNDYRPIALTSIVMKCFEKLVLRQLLTFTNQHFDPFQFAYRSHRGTDDAILTLLHNAFIHLNNPGSFVRILFIDFSSAFNTIQPHLLADKLIALDVDPKLILWIVNFLLSRTQSVLFQSVNSSQRSTSTGAPQGTVLAPILFTLYTNDCRGTEETPVIKYSDDSAIEDLSNSDTVYFSEIKKFCLWCKDNYLDLNVIKTKEMLIDFRKNPLPVPNLVIDGETVERVSEYRYLGTLLDKDMVFEKNVNFIHKKCQSRIFCLQKLRNIGINQKILQTYYSCCIESVLTVSFMCWYGSLNVRSKRVLNDVVNVCSKIVGVKQTCMQELYERRVRQKARQIANDDSHILAKYYDLLPSGRRYRTLKVKTRAQKSFIPQSIHFLNS